MTRAEFSAKKVEKAEAALRRYEAVLAEAEANVAKARRALAAARAEMEFEIRIAPALIKP